MSEMPMDDRKLSIIEQLCHSSIEVGIKKLCEIGTWPRPPAARRLRAGYDFHYDDIKDIHEVNNLIEYLASDDRIKSIYFGQSEPLQFWFFRDFWERLLLNILRETEGMTLNNRVFHKWFKKFVKELYSDTAVWRTVDTITGLTLRGAELKFDQATTLTSIPGYDLERFTQGQEQYFNHGWLAGGHDEATIITTLRIPKSQYAGSHWPLPHILKDTERSLAVMNAIRLTKPGVPRLHCHARFQLSYFTLHDPLVYCKHEGDLGLYEKETILDRSDFRNIRNLWQEFMDTRYKDFWTKRPKLDAMNTAFARFSKTYERQSWLDHIVDLTIALESLFGPKDNQELSHRISLRAAWLLGLDEKHDQDPSKVKNTIYDRVHTMYDIRSFRVHGGTPKEKDIRKWVQGLSGVKYDDSKYEELLQLALESARDIVRKAITACAKLRKGEADGPRWPFPKNFDGNIVIAGQRQVWQKAAGIKSKRLN